MDTKLTLRLNKRTVERAKEYAFNHNRSLSKMIDDYLTTLTMPEHQDLDDGDFQISPFVKSMSSGISVPADLDYKTAYSNRLTEKYS